MIEIPIFIYKRIIHQLNCQFNLMESDEKENICILIGELIGVEGDNGPSIDYIAYQLARLFELDNFQRIYIKF